jgi:hypothetical protein
MSKYGEHFKKLLPKDRLLVSHMFELVICRRGRDDIIEDLIKNYKSSINSKGMISILQEKLRMAWHTHAEGYSETTMLHDDVRDSIYDDNRDRAQSLRGI